MTKTVVILGFLLAFAAGLAVGMQSRQAAAKSATTRPSHRPGGWLTGELNLTPQQQEQLKKIWSDTASRGGREHEERRRQLGRERDEAIAALVRPEDKPQYEQILKNHTERTLALEREWRKSYEASVESTKQILTPEQRVKYEGLLQRQQAGRGPRDRHRGEREREIGRQGDDRATSRPSSNRSN